MDKIKLTKEWQALLELSKGDGLGIPPEADETANLNKKVMWFLKGGPVGVLQNIEAVFGKESLDEFLLFLQYFLEDQDSPGHYQPSKVNSAVITALKEENTKTVFSDYLENLKSELIELDRAKNDLKKEEIGRG